MENVEAIHNVTLIRTFRERFKKETDFRRRVLHTMCVSLVAIAAGWRITILGVTLPDIMVLIDENLSSSSWLLTSWSLGNLVGSLTVGILYDRFNKLMALLGIIVGMALTCIATPFCSTLVTMMTVQFIGGTFTIAGHSVCTADTIFVWKDASERYLLLVHFAISLGGVFCPLVSDPFIAKVLTGHSNSLSLPNSSSSNAAIRNLSEFASNVSEANKATVLCTKAGISNFVLTAASRNVIFNCSTGNDTEPMALIVKSPGMNLLIAYAILAVFCVTIVMLFIILNVTCGNVYAAMNSSNQHQNTNNDQGPVQMTKRVEIIFFVILQAVLITLYVGIQKHFSGFFMTYVIAQLQWTKTAGSYATAVFWISLGLGRLVAVFIVKRWKQQTLFVCYTGLVAVSIAAFVAFSILNILPCVIISLAVLGFAMAPLLAFMFTWLSNNVTTVTGKITGVIYTCISISSMVTPVVSGHLMEFYSYNWFLYIIVMHIVSFIVLYTFIISLHTRRKKRSTTTTTPTTTTRYGRRSYH